MRKIYVGLSTHIKFNLFSEGIKWIEGTDFSHAYVRFYSESTQRNLYYQASGLYVNFTNDEHFKSVSKIIHEYEIEVTEEQYVQVMQFCIDNVSKPYSMKEIFGILVYRTLGKKIIDSDKTDTFICSELVGYILHILKIIGDEDLDYFTPRDVFTVFNKK